MLVSAVGVSLMTPGAGRLVDAQQTRVYYFLKKKRLFRKSECALTPSEETERMRVQVCLFILQVYASTTFYYTALLSVKDSSLKWIGNVRAPSNGQNGDVGFT